MLVEEVLEAICAQDCTLSILIKSGFGSHILALLKGRVVSLDVRAAYHRLFGPAHLLHQEVLPEDLIIVLLLSDEGHRAIVSLAHRGAEHVLHPPLLVFLVQPV
jgi:hypothetical protein